MRNIILTIIIISIITSCKNEISNNNFENSKSEKIVVNNFNKDAIPFKLLPKIGDKLDDSITKMEISNMILFKNPDRFAPIRFIVCDGIKYNISWTKDGKLFEISTNDSNFATPEKFTINTTFKNIKKNQKAKVYRLPGWGYYLELKSGWKLVFITEETATSGRKMVIDSDSVKWIFK